MFQKLYHADWSMAAKGRWLATAIMSDGSWQVGAPRLLGSVPAFVDELFAAPGPVIAGFDFPIGVPETYGQTTGFADFPSALESFGHEEWSNFFIVAESADEVSRTRPFYPRASTAASKQVHLLTGLGVGSIDALRRRCDHKTPTRPAACPIFWTLGANQVGKAAISGWQEVIVPARLRGAHLWPFEGSLSDLVASRQPVLVETYPAEAYRHVGIKFSAGASKRRQADRLAAMAGLFDWARQRSINFSPELAAAVADGFGVGANGDDEFDALTGLLGMIEVVDGRRLERPAVTGAGDVWEGWILGQTE